jgi:5-formyltetrahydrofolate cyclo-ligase
MARDPSGRQRREDLLRQNLATIVGDARGTWAAYRSLPDEPDIFPSLTRQPGLAWAFPAVAGERLEFQASAEWRAEGAFARGSWGIFEPAPKFAGWRPIEAASLNGFLVPGIAFDRDGRRLGRGKGFYDRCLNGTKGFRVGVAFAAQLSRDPLPTEAHDARMDAVVTEEGIIWSSGRRPKRED